MNKEKPDSIIQTIATVEIGYYKLREGGGNPIGTEEVKRGEDVAGDSIHANISDMFHIGNPFNPFHEYKGLRHLQRALENIAIVRLGTYVTFVNYSTSILEAYDAVNMLAVKKVVPVKRGWIVAFILGGKGITFLS
ncbi:hypothetical protein ACJX0J_002580 (mitochondrion) [Zea mays]